MMHTEGVVGLLCCLALLAPFVVAVVRGTLRRLRPAQRVVICLGWWAAVVQVYYPPHVEVRGTPPVIDLDPPTVPRYPRTYPLPRRPLNLTGEPDYNLHSPGVYRDVPRLAVHLLITAAVTGAACVLVGRLPASCVRES